MKIIDNIIFNNGIETDLNSIFTKDFYKYSDSKADYYDSKSFESNEVFTLLIQPYLALEFFMKKHKVTSCSVKNNDLYSLIIKDIATNNSLEYTGKIWAIKQRYRLSFYIKSIASAFYLIYLMILIRFKNETIDKGGDFAILRSKPAISKFKNFPDIKCEVENPKSQESIYRLFPLSLRVWWVISSYLESFVEISNIRRKLSQQIGVNSSFWAYDFYAERLVHTLFVRRVYDSFFKKQSGKKYYTANNLDRFSVIEEDLSKKYNMFSICIPHGIEYGFKFPRGFSCDLFYTNSKFAETYLNKLYNTTKFIFDYDVAEKMLKTSFDSIIEKRVVFLTEPREPEVNCLIIEELIPLLEKKGIPLFIKYHPKDKLENYSKYGLPTIQNLSEAVSNNICFSRKSTTLLEASYSGSLAAAILINEKDKAIFYTFPSLQDKRITVCESISQLFDWIVCQYGKNKQF